MGPCMCGALDCPSCGRAQGTYYEHTTYCDACNELLADCGCDDPEPRDPRDDYDEPDYDDRYDEREADRAADAYEERLFSRFDKY